MPFTPTAHIPCHFATTLRHCRFPFFGVEQFDFASPIFGAPLKFSNYISAEGRKSTDFSPEICMEGECTKGDLQFTVFKDELCRIVHTLRLMRIES